MQFSKHKNLEYEISQEYFEKLFYIDPHRYENTDIYSNILFIKENYCDLANLAYRCFQNDKYRPETCCVIGNFYGLKGKKCFKIIFLLINNHSNLAKFKLLINYFYKNISDKD